jgi:hypothetical protein
MASPGWEGWTVRRRVMIVVLVVLLAAFVGIAWFIYRLIWPGPPNVAVDYWAKLRAEAPDCPPEDQARLVYLELGDYWTDPLPRDVDDLPRPGTDAWDEIGMWLTRSAHQVDVARRAAARPCLGFDFDQPIQADGIDPADRGKLHASVGARYYTQLMTGVDARHALVVLVASALQGAEAGQAVRYADDIEAALRIGSHLGELPHVFEQHSEISSQKAVLGTILEVMAERPDLLDAVQISSLERAIREVVTDERLSASPTAVRYEFLDFVQRAYTASGPRGGRLTKQGKEYFERNSMGGALSEASQRALRDEVTRKFEELWAMLESDRARPLWQMTFEAASEMDRLQRDPAARYQVAMEHLPILPHLMINQRLLMQQRDATIVMLRALRHRRSTGQWPDSIEVIFPDPELRPIDRLDGGLLRYRLTEDGPIVYSVGLDGDDDGGRPPEPDSDLDRPFRWRWHIERRHRDEPPVDGDLVLYPRPVEE